MTASMKRLRLEDNVAYRYQPDWQWSWRRLSCYLSSCLSLIRGVKLSQRRLALRHRLHLFPLLQLSACRVLPLVSFCFSLHFSLRSSLPSGRSLIQAPHPATPHPLAPAPARSSLPLVFISPSVSLCSPFSFPGRGSRARLVLMNPCRPPQNPHSDFLKWLWQGLKGALGFAKTRSIKMSDEKIKKSFLPTLWFATESASHAATHSNRGASAQERNLSVSNFHRAGLSSSS